MPTPQTWQERFDERFAYFTLNGSGHLGKPWADDIKSFLAEEIAKAEERGRKQVVEKLKSLLPEGSYTTEDMIVIHKRYVEAAESLMNKG